MIAAAVTAVGAYSAAADTPAARATGPAHAGAGAAQGDTVTGCLQRGQSPDRFTLATKDGKTYMLAGSPSQLSGHVGHTVSVVGSPGAMEGGEVATRDTNGMSGMSDSTKKGGTTMSAGMLNVTSVKMVAPSCS